MTKRFKSFLPLTIPNNLNWVFGFIPVLAIVAVIWLSATNVSTLYLRQDATVWMVFFGAVALGAALWGLTRRALYAVLPVAVWVLLSGLSIFWSLSPAATVRASAWHFLYLAAFVVGLRWPKYFLTAFVAANLALVFKGIDFLLVTQSFHLVGVWFNKNVQGAQFLLFVPLLAYLAFGKSRWVPYLAFLVGLNLFFASLTKSAAAQILLVLGVLFLLWLQRKILFSAGHRFNTLAVFGLLVAGGFMGWLLIQPPAVQVFGIGIGQVQGESLDKTNSIRSLHGRLNMIDDVGSRAIGALPFGTGAGTLRNIYSGLQTHPETESVDAHNYYVQTFMTLGVPGVILLLWLFISSFWSVWRMRQWGLIVSLFLFMGYLAFDVPAYFPAIMMLFFGLMGVASSYAFTQRALSLRAKRSGARQSPHTRNAGISSAQYENASNGSLTQPRGVAASFRSAPLLAMTNMSRYPRKDTNRLSLWKLAALLPLLAVPLLWLWWMAPCSDIACALGRKMGDRETVRQLYSDLNLDEQLTLLAGAKSWNPESLWEYRLYATTYERTEDDEGLLAVHRKIATKFPAADLGVYRDWRQTAASLGNHEAFVRASKASVEHFPLSRNELLWGFEATGEAF